MHSFTLAEEVDEEMDITWAQRSDDDCNQAYKDERHGFTYGVTKSGVGDLAADKDTYCEGRSEEEQLALLFGRLRRFMDRE